jgi:hypothetical protein
MDMLELKIYLRQIFTLHIYINFRKRETSAESKEGCTAGMVMSLIAIQN